MSIGQGPLHRCDSRGWIDSLLLGNIRHKLSDEFLIISRISERTVKRGV